MIPLRDIIPTRTAPAVTRALAVVLAGIVLFMAWERGWNALPSAVGLLLLWLFGPTLEDRMGHGRFSAFLVLCAAAAVAINGARPLLPLAAAGWTGAVGGLAAAHVTLYPHSRVTALVPVWGLPIVEIPAFVFPVCWLIVQAAGAPPWAALAGVAAGAATGRLFRRRERMRVEWWNALP